MPAQVFVLGNSRSGTTMLARILGMSREGADLNELHFIEQMVTGENFQSEAPLKQGEAVALASQLISVARDGYFQATSGIQYTSEASALVSASMTSASLFEAVRFAEASRLSKSIPIDQTPRNVFYMGEILAAYEDARVVCMVRDPRDVCLSQKRKWRRRFLGAKIPLLETLRSWVNYHPWVASKMWASAIEACKKFSDDPRVLVVRFEDVVLCPEENIRKICDHCGLVFQQKMLDVEQVGSSGCRDKRAQLGLDSDRVGGWKKGLSRAEIAICESQTARLLTEQGYVISGQKANVVIYVLWTIVLPLKLGLALAFNLRRVRNIFSWTRKRLGRL